MERFVIILLCGLALQNSFVNCDTAGKTVFEAGQGIEGYSEERRIELGGEKCRESPEDASIIQNKTSLQLPEPFKLYKFNKDAGIKVSVTQTFYKRQRCDDDGIFWKYDGEYSKGLTVSKPVSIISFGFFGPIETDNATYEVSMQILVDGESIATRQVELNGVEKRQIFHALFNKPVPLEAGKYYSLQFSLKGPGTYSSNYPISKIKGPYGDDGVVTFNMEWNGWYQLAQIGYTVPAVPPKK